jgi:hypothetical protein
MPKVMIGFDRLIFTRIPLHLERGLGWARADHRKRIGTHDFGRGIALKKLRIKIAGARLPPTAKR